MQRHIPQIDITPTEESYPPPSYDRSPWFRSRRFIIFIIAFFLSVSIALGYVFSRQAIYQSYATLLTVAKTSIDQQSSDADIQHVAIQKQILMGSELLAETSRRLQFYGSEGLKVADIRRMLDVRPVADTNLVEMIAEGPEANVLPALINTWIDVYLAARAKEIARSTGATTEIIQSELDGQMEKINAKRIELDQFRKNNDITSAGREENEALARLSGLNESLNTASEEEVKAKARLDSINRAIARGQAVIPQEDTRTLSLLENRAQELREELEELDRRYTREFMALSPDLKVVPEKLAALELEIKRMRQSGQSIVVSDAQQEYAAAKQAVSMIRSQLDKHRKKATEFTTRFAEHEALQSDLEALELLHRETQERLVQIKTRHTGKYPQVDVIERAFLPNEPIRPNYFLDTIIAVAGSIIFSLFCVWISEFLTRKAQPKSAINLSGVHFYSTDAPREVLANAQQGANVLAQPQQYALEKPAIREISSQEIDILIHSANDKEKLLIALLLSGVNLEEIPTIQQDNIDFDKDKLTIVGSSPRTIPLNPALRSLLSNPNCHLIGPAGEPLTEGDLTALLTCAIIDAGLPAQDEMSAASLKHTYIIYLVRQGIRLSDLELIVGYIAPTERSGYSAYSPPGPGRSFKDIDLLYPGLAACQA
jgi:polysaccharide biosynthesis transport protein